MSQERNKTTNNTNDEHSTVDFAQLLHELKVNGLKRKAELSNVDATKCKPHWYDEQKMEHCRRVYARHLSAINLSHFFGLILLVRVRSIFHTLQATGASATVAKLFRRYLMTALYVKSWYEGDVYAPDSEAHRNLVLVRGMHDRVSRKLNSKPDATTQTHDKDNDDDRSQRRAAAPEQQQLMQAQSKERKEGGEKLEQVHISEYDMMLTQFAFVGFILLKPEFTGLGAHFDEYDLECVLHFWRVIGHAMGASEQYNLCAHSVVQVRLLCNVLLEREFKPALNAQLLSDGPGLMSINIVRSQKFIPVMTVYASHHLLYEMCEHTLSENDRRVLDQRRSWFSRTSYVMMRQLLCHWLQYSVLRAMHNALVRFTLWLVHRNYARHAQNFQRRYGDTLTT